MASMIGRQHALLDVHAQAGGACHGRQRPHSLVGVVVLVVALLLGGCGTPARATTSGFPPPPNTHIPHARLIPGVQQLEINTHFVEIEDAVSFVPSNNTHPHVLFLLVNDLYEMADDGTDLHRVPMPVPCNVAFTLSPDDEWIACNTQSGSVEVAPVAVPSPLGQTPHAPLQLVAPDPNATVTTPAWSPDPALRLLAVMERAESGCTLLLYRLAAGFDHLDHVATLALPQLLESQYAGGGFGCPIGRLAWSPDSESLAFSVTHPPDATVYVFDLSTFIGQLRKTTPLSTLISARIANTAVSSFGTSGYAQPTWLRLAPDVVALLATNPIDRDRIVRLDSHRAGGDVLLTVPQPYRVCGLSVNIGNAPLVFTLCAGGGDRLLALPNLYVYTPSS